MHILAKTLIGISLASTVVVNQISAAYCERCMKIEEARAKEQAKHPQLAGYYDDQVNLHQKESPSKSKSLVAFFNELEALQNSKSNIDKNERPLSSFEVGQAYSMIYTIFKTKDFLETLDGSFSLFIPTNQALQEIPNDLLIDLMKPENQEKLAALVSNHVVAKKILKKDLESYHNQHIKAISGKNLTIQVENGRLSINNAHILRVEPAGYDGIIYIVDKVFVP